MARIVEDSGDELPDLAELLKDSRKQPSRVAATRSRKTPKPDQQTEEMSKRAPTEATEGYGQNTKAKPRQEISKAKPRKRILKTTVDNPLLHPIASSAVNKASAKLRGNETVKSRQKENRTTAPLSESHSDIVSDEYESSSRNKSREIRTKPTKQDVKQKTRSPAKRVIHIVSSDDEDYEGASGLSDFIVDDSTLLDEKDSPVLEAQPPRSVRRLVQGRRRRVESEDSDSDDLGRRMKTLNLETEVSGIPKKGSVERDLEVTKNSIKTSPTVSPLKKTLCDKAPAPSWTMKEAPRPTALEALGTDIEDPFTLRFSPTNTKPRKTSKETRFVTPPGSPTPKPKRLQSPSKVPCIPLTPHRPSMDSFWQQDVINDWNDEYSPQKALNLKQTLNQQEKEGTCPSSPKKSPSKQDKIVREAKKAFSESKHALAEKFLAELDARITNGEIAKLAASTGGVKIIWSKKLNTTAGRANWKRETIKSSSSSTDGKPIHRHHAAIELAEKVIDDENRLLNVIAHEFCHLANFMVSNIKTNPHGKEFKAWAVKCSRHFGDRGIEVTTKHSYTIDYKYIWECINCGTEFKRHSKSIDPARHQCGSCKNKLVQTKPVPRANAGTTKVSGYQLFMKENMKRLMEENPGSPQKEIMGLVGKEYQVYKASQLSKEIEKSMESVSIDEDVGSKELTPDDDVETVARKLDFLDLTSP